MHENMQEPHAHAFGDGIWADVKLKALGRTSEIDGNVCDTSAILEFIDYARAIANGSLMSGE